MREKVGKSRNTAFFQWFVAPGGRKVGSLKPRVRSQLARWVMKNCTPLWREAHFEVKMHKTPQRRTTFGSCDVEKVHAVVARSTFPSENVQNTPCSDHFWKLRCRKSARRCGAKHISKWKCTKHTREGPLLAVEMSKKCAPLWREAHFQIKMYKTLGFGPLLEVEMSKKCTPLWREAHFQVKMYKALGVRTTFGGWDVEKVHAVLARSTFPSENVQNTPCSDHFWKLRCRKSARRCGAKHISKWKCTKHTREGPLLAVEMSKKCAPLWREAHFQVKMCKTLGVQITFGGSDVASLHYTTLHYTPLHSSTLNYTTPHYITLRSTTLHYTYTTLHHITLHYTPLHYITLYYAIFHYTSLPYTTLHSITLQLQLHYIPLHHTTLHYTPLHCTQLHYTTLHYTPLRYTTFHYTALH